MKALHFKSALSVAALLLASFAAQASDTVTDPNKPRALPADASVVAVSWTDPAQFSDLKYSGNRWQANQGDWVNDLAKYLRKSASKRLQPGEKLDVQITDIMRAGQYEPWHGPRMDDVRIVRDHYPPRIDLTYTLTGADGQVIAQGNKELRDLGFMMTTPPISDSDPLRYEKQMLDQWTRSGMRVGAPTASN